MKKMIEAKIKSDEFQGLPCNVISIREFREKREKELLSQSVSKEVSEKILSLINELEVLVKTGDRKFSASF